MESKRPPAPERIYTAAQQPTMWFLSAVRLRDAAEIILKDQEKSEILYLQAHELASQKALALAISSKSREGAAEIQCKPISYVPAQMLYVFAFENVFKGLLVSRNTSLISKKELNKQLKSHNLIKLAQQAYFEVFEHEHFVLFGLTELIVWSGRYPCASNLRQQGVSDQHFMLLKHPESNLDWGSQHPTMRLCFQRALLSLESCLSKPVSKFDLIVVSNPLGDPK